MAARAATVRPIRGSDQPVERCVDQCDELLEFVGLCEPRVVILGHGDGESRAWFTDQIRAKHPKIRVEQPGPGVMVEA